MTAGPATSPGSRPLQPIEGAGASRASLLGADDDTVRLRLDDGKEADLPLRDIRRAKLVMTDALIDDATAPTRRRTDQLTNRNREDTWTPPISRPEMLQVADMVAREKIIEREEVLEAMEQAIQKAGRAKYGHENDIRAEIDRKTGEIKLLR